MYCRAVSNIVAISTVQTVCNSLYTAQLVTQPPPTERKSADAQPARQAAVFTHYQPVTKYFVVITTKLRDVNYHNSKHIISSSLNNMSSCKTEESANEMQNDQHTIRYKKFSSYIRVSNYDSQNNFSPLEGMFIMLHKDCTS